MIEFVYPMILYFGIPVILIFAYLRWFYHKEPIYLFSSLVPFAGIAQTSNKIRELFLFLTKLAAFLLIIFAIARPRIPDEKSKLPVQGIDIVLSLDVSGSMEHSPELGGLKSKFSIAQEEAIRFIEKRKNDAIGLVIFGAVAVSRCPLTLDKKMLKQIINDTYLGIINPDGTVLAQSLLTALNRLKFSKAKSKIIIALTDGQPSMHDVDPNLALDLAKKLNVKIYTIGVGSEKIDFRAFLAGVQSHINIDLLKKISKDTGGKFFLAENATDLENIYSEIDKLEKTEHEMPIYGKYFEYFGLLLWMAFILIFAELGISSLWWLRL